MKRLLTIASTVLVGFAGLLLAQDNKPVAKQCTTRVVSFKNDVLPLLQERCMACHYDEQAWPGLDLSQSTAYAQIVNHKGLESGNDVLVKPSDPEHSFLVNKISAKPRVGNAMPPYGGPMTAQEKTLLVEWIRQGAKNN